MKIKKFKVLISALLSVFGFLFFTTTTSVYATTTVNLLTTDNFAVLGKTGVSDVPASVISGDVGLSAGAGITGLTCSEVTGTIYDGDAGYGGACRVTDAAKLTQAENDLVTASGDAAGRTPTTTYVTGDNQLGGKTLTDGVYAFGSASTANLTGTLTLDGEGNSNAVWIFQASSDLVTASSSVVKLTNGAQACNVFWVVSSQATLGSSSYFIGTIMAGTSVVLNNNANLSGRALASTAAVTMNQNTIAKPTCSSASTSSSTSSTSTFNSSTETPYYACPPIDIGITAPTIIGARRVDADSIYFNWGPYTGTDKFNVRYGMSKDKLLYNVDVTGFSMTINALPANQPIWVQIAARNDCMIGIYEASRLVGGPSLPNAGFGPSENSTPWYFLVSIFNRFLSRR